MAARNHHYLSEELVWEILRLLPVKSLMRFKCVCRIWLSIIMDPSFASAHRGGCRGLLVPTDTNLDQFSRLTNTRYFFYVNLDDDDGPNRYSQVISPYITVNHGPNIMGITDLVNGLMCFYNCNYSFLLNFATRETLQLPVSNYDSQACSYHFGFDPFNKLYKLLKICPVYDNYNHAWESGAVFVRHLNCEVLTIGVDSSWRIIEPPPFKIKSRSVCLGGILYWMEEVYQDERRLSSFNLVEEKFQVIPLPRPIGPMIAIDDFYLPRYGPGLLLFFGVNILGSGRMESLMVRGGGGGVWGDEQKLILQTSDKTSDGFFGPDGILPNGKLVMFNEKIEDGIGSCSLYLFDQSKRCVEKEIAISLGPPFSAQGSLLIYMQESLYLEENIIPLTCLTPTIT